MTTTPQKVAVDNDGFVRWIDTVTPKRLADVLGTTLSVVYQWRERRYAPRPEIASRIVQMSLGQVSWGDIYEPYVRVKAERKA